MSPRGLRNAVSKDLKHISWIFCFRLQKNIMLSVPQRIQKNFNKPTTSFGLSPNLSVGKEFNDWKIIVFWES